MKKKIAICGADGMLGSMVLDYFARSKNYQVTATLREKSGLRLLKSEYPTVKWEILDATASAADFTKLLEGNAWIINCIGIIKPYIHDDNPIETEMALKINSLFPYRLAQAALKIKARVIQIETDCVFSGKRGKYRENDLHDALDVYGKTKSLGEVYFNNVYHLRCSIVGPEKKSHRSLLDWFLSQNRGAKIQGFINHSWNGITTLHFAKICEGIIKKDIRINHLQHIVPVDSLSKGKLLGIFKKAFGRQDISIKMVKASEEINRTLETNNITLNKKIWRSAGYAKVPSIEAIVKELAVYVEGKK